MNPDAEKHIIFTINYLNDKDKIYCLNMKLSGRQKVIEQLLEAYADMRQPSGNTPTTDERCISFLMHNGPSTAGDIARHTGLTSGAVTSLIDRLERGGYARRELDRKDRRRVLVRALPRKTRSIAETSEAREQSLKTVLDTYTLEELAIISDFLRRAGQR